MESMKMYRKAVLVLCLILSSPFVSGATGGDTGKLQVKIAYDRLTMTAVNVYVKDFFKELEKQSGISIRYFGNTEDVISADIVNCPLDVGLDIITKGFNHSVVYEGSANGEDLVISSLFIYSRETREEIHYVDNLENTDKLHQKLVTQSPRHSQDPGGVTIHTLTPENAIPSHLVVSEGSDNGADLVNSSPDTSSQKGKGINSDGSTDTLSLQVANQVPQFHQGPGGVAVHALTPVSADPLLTMSFLDPLSPFDDGRPVFDAMDSMQNQFQPPKPE